MSDDLSNQSERSGDDLGAIDVAVLMAHVRIVVPKDKRGDRTVTVQGTVKALRRSDKTPATIYGDLRGFDDSVISFRVPAASGLKEEDHVVLRGELTSKVTKMHRGLDLELTGTRVGTWTPVEPYFVDRRSLERRADRLSLERFLAENEVNALLRIGTRTGMDDAQAVAGGSLQFRKGRQTSTALDSLLVAITEAARDPECSGLCLLRGGGDPSSFSTWNDSRLIEALIGTEKPFYTALGHTHDLTLADKYADECFVTPSALGKACADALRVRAEQHQKDQRLKQCSVEIQKLRAAKQGGSQTDIDQKTIRLQTILDEFQKLPATLLAQTGQTVAFAIRSSLQEDLRRPVADAIQGSVANLTQITEQARVVLAKTIKELRLHAWTWLLFVFVLGVFAGAYGLYSLERSTMFGTRHEATGAQQPSPPSTKPPEVRPGSGRRGH